jgi:ABC-type polysaccharide/polyol phosphate transport system ATPase subunit
VTAVELEHVWKRYQLGGGGGARGALRRWLRPAGAEEYFALRDVSLRVAGGESVGLIGANGAGKSTVLKLVAGISRPSRGRVRTGGRVASLLNVGAGFHPELTGRENVLLNGVILGLSRSEVAARYDAIVDFAGLEDFMDTPVKFFSSGMYARLAFAVAAHVEPDVLLVDEVLSVGDAWFQDRSLRRMLAFREAGAAVLFVSHNLAAVELMCQRAVWLDRGRVRATGPTAEVVRAYLDAMDEPDAPQGNANWLSVSTVEVLDVSGAPTERLASGEPFSVRVAGRALRDLHEPVFVVTVRGQHGPLFAANMHIDGRWPARVPAGPFVVRADFGPVRLTAGDYRVELKVKQNVRTNFFEPRVLARFRVGDGAGPALADAPARWSIQAERPPAPPAFAPGENQVPSLAATES